MKTARIDIFEWESHIKSVLGQENPNKEQNRAPANGESDRTETFVPELDNPITEHEVRKAK